MADNVVDLLAFVERAGMVLESARHASVPNLVEHIVGRPVRGSWWAHPKGHEIYVLLNALRDADAGGGTRVTGPMVGTIKQPLVQDQRSAAIQGIKIRAACANFLSILAACRRVRQGKWRRCQSTDVPVSELLYVASYRNMATVAFGTTAAWGRPASLRYSPASGEDRPLL